jgi:aryl-alcohol dehydrogenase-like predicted oxidoreductase
VVLATKGGYGVPGVPDWTGEVIRRGIDAALTRLRTEVIDIFLLHSCDSATLLRDDILHELTQAKLAGKIQAAGYSGDNEALGAAITSGCFDVVECSVNPFDRTSLLDHVEAAEGSGIGVLAKRSLGNAAWRQTARPDAPDLRTYWDRAQLMNLEVAPDDWSAACVRFAAFAPGIASALVGTSSLAHLQAAVCAVGRGPLESATLTHFDDAWKLHASHWAGVT